MALAAKTKKQSCVSHSTPEAEILSINLAMRTLGIAALNIWDMVLGSKAGVDVMEDNDATCLIIKSGRNPALKHMSRTHDVNVAWLNEVFKTARIRAALSAYLGSTQ